MAGIGWLVSDFLVSFMWVWSGILIQIFVQNILGFGREPFGKVIKCALAIIKMFFFSFLAKVTKGGAYNPLIVLSSAISGNFSHFLFTVGARIPAQVIGSIVAVRNILEAFPEVDLGPRLNIDIHQGALTEGILTFVIVIISLGLRRKTPTSFFIRTWISGVFKLTIHILGSDLYGGCMNPASVMGWAYARDNHIRKEHILIYWLAPIEATLLAVWTFRLIFPAQREQKVNTKTKSDQRSSTIVHPLESYALSEHWKKWT